MNKNSGNENPLRAAAEAELAHAPETNLMQRPAGELRHELQVHQIELEMQNETLRQTQIALEESRDRYVDLYEFAPVSYLTLTDKGMIGEINLTGSALLKMERNKLLHRRFASLVAPEHLDRWNRLFVSALQERGIRNCELTLNKGDGESFHAYLDCMYLATGDKPPVLRITLTDITARKQQEQQLRDLYAHLQTVREEEKTSMAREIHDDLGGTLTALKMEAYWLAEELSSHREVAPLLEHIESMAQLIDNATNVTRRVITGLRPTMLDDFGLPAALEWQAAQFHKYSGIECRVNCIANKGGEKKLDKIRSINLFRIFHGALTNVARHSGASRVEVEFHHGDGEILLSISDNGCGMTEKCAGDPMHYGILGMTERVDQLGGKIKFDSPPGGGFSVTVSLPLAGQKMGEA